MNTSELVYKGELRTIAKHVYSGTEIFTDAPLDNHGKAQSFSPTDLMAASLAMCMVTIMGIECQKLKVNIDDTKIAVRKIMNANPRRVSRIEIDFDIPDRNLTDEIKRKLEYAAHNCPVAKSVHSEIEQLVSFKYY